MAYVRQLKVNNLTYKEFAARLLKYIVRCVRSTTRISVVFDVYGENLIKDVERLRRSSGESVIKNIVATSSIKQWNQLLSSGDFKNKLVDYFVTEWKKDRSAIGDKTIFVTNNRFLAYKLTTDLHQMVEELESDHEEADTRMLLHAKPVSLTYERIIISTPDNDVFIIASKLAGIKARLYILTRTKDKRRIIDLNVVSKKAFHQFNKTKSSKNLFMSTLLGFHAFTGCDTTSAFSGRGKVKPLQIMGSSSEYIQAFASLGMSMDVGDDLLSDLVSFVCHMYGKKEKDAERQRISINDVRYTIYCQKSGKISCNALPLCWNSLKQHIIRANYQTLV